MVINRHEIVWVTPAPLWKATTGTPDVLRRPTILGYGHDGFMDELLGTLAGQPDQIAARVATGPSRSFRQRRPGEAYDFVPTTAQAQLKLYQPVHGWFYLVAGSLVCQLPGLPDHPVDLGAGEKAGFVVRRLDDQRRELALVANSVGKRSWQAAPAGVRPTLAAGEELLPLFPLGFNESTRRRKLMAGMIPTGSQDAFQAAPLGAAAAAASDDNAMPGPAEALEDVKGRFVRTLTILQADDPPVPADQAREQSRFALMDLADFLTFYLPAVMTALGSGGAPGGQAGALTGLLRHRTVDSTVDGKSFADLLAGILNAPLTDAFAYDLGHSSASPDELAGALQAALEEATSQSIAQIPVEVQTTGATLYVTRLVYQRPRCGTLHTDVVSPPSEPFTLAPYFDPDAPSRPIRIALPFDSSINGLRQFRKNVKMVLSDKLRQAMSRDKINDSVPGPGVDCGGLELSIPIITIVAMIILFVFISLLNIIFWWIPFVKICLPKIDVEL